MLERPQTTPREENGAAIEKTWSTFSKTKSTVSSSKPSQSTGFNPGIGACGTGLEAGSTLRMHSLRDMAKPIGIAGYELTTILPEDLRGGLPTVDELEEELSQGER